MKDVLNKKVKNREWYRPFAPVVRLEDAPIYFDFPEGMQSRHMTYVADIKEEYRDVIPAVTHEDNTGRIQTVTSHQNPFLYELLTEFSEVSEHSVLLNTSFNINGKPILTRLSEALELLANTKMDAVFYKNKLVFLKGEEEKFTKNIISENIQPLSDETTVYLMTYDNDVSNHSETNRKVREVIDLGQKNVVLVGTPKVISILRENFKDAVEYFEITDNLLYYHEAMQESYPELKLTASDFAPMVRMLWMKNIMYKNFYRTTNHMFVSLDEYESVAKNVNIVANLAKENDKIVVDGGSYDGEFTTERLEKYINVKTIPKKVPQFGMVWGNIENIEWLSVNYEGQLLNFMRGNVVGSDKDFGLVTYLKSPEKFKIW